MVTHRQRLLSFAMVLASSAAAAAADPPVRFPPATSDPRGDRLEWLVDEGRRLSFEEVRSAAYSGAFAERAVAQKEGWSDPHNALWLRFRLVRESPGDWMLVIGNLFMEEVCLYWPRPGGYETVCTGAAAGFDARLLPHRAFVFPIPEELGDQPVYIRAASTLSLSLKLEILPWQALYEEVRETRYKNGLYYGFMLAIVLYNLFLFLSVRDPVYLYYMLHIGTFALGYFGFDGLGAEYLWPETPALRAVPLYVMSSTYFFGVFYVRRFLLTARHAPKLDLALLAVAAFNAAGILAYPFASLVGRNMIFLSMPLFSVVVLTAAIVRLRDGYRPARFLLLALAMFLSAVPLSALAQLKLISLSFGTIADFVRVGAALGALMLSFGLADRLRELSAERERLIPELEAKNAEMERFLYTVSHDLRTPLVTIGGFLGLLEKDAAGGPSERLEQDVETIRAATDQMNRLLHEVVELSRLERVVNPSEQVPLAAAAKEAVEPLARRIEAHGVRVEISEDLPVVVGDHKRLVEMLRSLIDNAIQFADQETEPVVEVGLRGEEDGRAVCFVRDNGIGIEPAYHERIFGLFDRLDAGGEGIGVGLTLVRRIVEIHGGRIWVESEGKGQGSTFCFTLERTA